jgi:hypothetical protein
LQRRAADSPGGVTVEVLEDDMQRILTSTGSPPSENVAARDVLAERERQKTVEGWTPEHDDQHEFEEMAMAAVCYAHPQPLMSKFANHPVAWPWDEEWWKPKDRRRNLVRAAALIIAEIERLDRATVTKSVESP